MGKNTYSTDYLVDDQDVFELISARVPANSNLRQLEWAVIAQLDGKKTVKAIADTLDLSKSETREIFQNLIDKGLLNRVGDEKEREYLTEEELAQLEQGFLLVMGPVASLLVDEVLNELNCKRPKVPLSLLPVLIEFLSLEIENEKKRVKFQKSILPLVRKRLLK